MLLKFHSNHFLPVTCDLPVALLPWLTYKDSLTERLKKKAVEVRLDVVGQRWVDPTLWDKQVLLMNDDRVLRREIIMWAGEEACWYARTIIPEASYKARPFFFDRLQNEALGVLLFSEPNKVVRADMIYYPIAQQSIEYTWLPAFLHCDAPVLWVRGSVFLLENQFPFYLFETLLPDLERYLS